MAVLAPPDWQYPTRDNTMDLPSSNSRQRSSPASDHSPSQTPSLHHQQQQPQQMQQPQQSHQQAPYSYPGQQPQGGWTPSITAQPFYPSFYQNHQSQQPFQHHGQSQISSQSSYFDPANAQFAQWAYQQMMFNAQQGFSHIPPTSHQHHSSQQRSGSLPPSSTDYFTQNQISAAFNLFPSGTPPPQHGHHRVGTGDHNQGQLNGQYSGFHPYRRPKRQQSHSSDNNDWRSGGSPHPPYLRLEAAASTSSVNSTNSQRQRTNSNQSGQSSHTIPSANGSVRSRNGSPATSSSARSSPSPGPSSATPSSRVPHHRNMSSSSSGSTSASSRPSVLPPSLSATTASSSSSSSSPLSATPSTPRPARPSPLSQGTFTASEKRMSRDDSDLTAIRDQTPSASMLRSGGLKGRLRRALSFSTQQALQEETDDDDQSIKASASSNKLKPKLPVTNAAAESAAGIGMHEVTPSALPTKKKGRAASLFNSRINASTDNISLSSTVSSASVMIRKLGSMGRLARRNSLAGITSLFKDKEKDKDGEGKDKDKKGKKDKKGSGAKGEASEASVSHVTAELDRTTSGDWNVGGEMSGLSPAAKLARQHTLKSNAEAAAKAKAQQEAMAAATANVAKVNGIAVNGAGVPTWERNTATRQGSASPVKGGGGMRVNEDGTRVLVEDDDDDRSDDGSYVGGAQPHGQNFRADGWNDEDWGDGDDDEDEDEDEDVTIKAAMERISRISTEDDGYSYGYTEEPEPWALDVRRSVEKTRTPSRGILKYAGSYNQQAYLIEQHALTRVRSNSYNSHPGPTSELGPLARIPSPDPDHIDGLHRHPSHSSSHSNNTSAPSIPPLSFESSSSPIAVAFTPDPPKEVSETPSNNSHNQNPLGPHPPEKSSIFNHPNFNSSAPALSTISSSAPVLTHRSATAPSKRLAFANNLSVYDTFPASVYDRRSEPATWSRLTPALAQRIKEELNSYKMEEMEVHAASRIHTQFFV